MDGFAIGPTVNPCTKGLWIWSAPIEYKEMDIIILDTEGLNSVYRDSSTDCKILAIALLVSSILVYNSMGTIDEQALFNLGLVINLVKYVKIDKNSGSKDLARYFPYFLWTLRDFGLNLGDITADQYLEQSLGANKNGTQASNEIRSTISQLFRERSCETFVRPVFDEGKLARIEDQKYEDLRPEFRETTQNFTEKIFKNLRPKIMNGKGLTGNMLLEFTEMIIESFNNNDVPYVSSSLERVLDKQANDLSMMLETKYVAVFQKKIEELNINNIESLMHLFLAIKGELGNPFSQY